VTDVIGAFGRVATGIRGDDDEVRSSPPTRCRNVITIELPLWMKSASCRELDPVTVGSLFFPVDGSTREARAICGSCVVAADCLDFALDEWIPYGIWGGKTPAERRALRTRRSRRQRRDESGLDRVIGSVL
jgi:WhiB family redox-sensing transcriptional regulator